MIRLGFDGYFTSRVIAYHKARVGYNVNHYFICVYYCIPLASSFHAKQAKDLYASGVVGVAGGCIIVVRLKSCKATGILFLHTLQKVDLSPIARGPDD